MLDALHDSANVAKPALATNQPPAPAPSASFAALLERLQEFAGQKAALPPVQSADGLHEAMSAADRSFTTAMQLRQQLEEAFRRYSP
jgi:hypothetical protein